MTTLTETVHCTNMTDVQVEMTTRFADGWNLQGIVQVLVPVQGVDNIEVMQVEWDITFTKEVE